MWRWILHPGAAAPPSPSPAPAPRRQGLRRFVIGALVLVALLKALQLRALATAQQGTGDDHRRQLVDAASSLLAPAPQPMPAAWDRAPGGQAPQAADGTPGPAPAPSPLAYPSAGPGAAAGDLRATLVPLRQFAQLSAHDAWPAVAAPSPLPGAPQAQAGQAPPASRPAPPRASAHRQIPELLEGIPVTRRDADALGSLTILGSLRFIEEQDSPYVVVALRTDAGAARVQLGSRPGARAWLAPTGWLEVGDAPAPGWRVVRIDAGAVDLLTPAGNPLRLHGPAGYLRADPAPVQPRKPSPVP
jgi:hypothetical protein